MSVALAAVLALGGWALWSANSGNENDTTTSAKAAHQPASDDIRETVEPAPRGGAGHMVASVMTKELQPKQSQATPGTWATDKVLVKGRYDKLEAVKIGADTEAWTKVLPGPICGFTSLVTVDEKTAVLFRDKEHGDLCNQVGFIDLNSGHLLWKATFPGKSKMGSTIDPTTVTMTRGVVVTSWQAKGAAAFDMHDGTELWRRSPAQDCSDLGFAGGGALSVVRACAPESAGAETQPYQVQRISARTGKAQWTYKVAEGVKGVSLVSSKPLVIGVGAGGEGQITDLISLGENGKYRATIRLEGGHYEVKCDSYYLDQCSQVVVGKKQVFVTSSEKNEGINDTTNWIVGFDLGTGRSGMKFDAGDDRMIYPVRMSGDSLLAYKVSTDGYAPNSVVSLDPVTGKESEYFYFNVAPENRAMVSGGENDDVLIENGRVFFGTGGITGEGEKGSPLLVTTAIGIGRAHS
ncbi:PQQ-binding-like beta-propeller repeat protein [Streptomyces sp. SID5785]|uniref:outer membrane protein assembly factor BamB family protein n=1 Tax=Streptomyces sp. SID5785 TaxID=2690309 RepID=UPI00136B7C4D|nr:PQQ-binding-like beta-propeller repeat protein [Streptomyces sp. SID5785]